MSRLVRRCVFCAALGLAATSETTREPFTWDETWDECDSFLLGLLHDAFMDMDVMKKLDPREFLAQRPHLAECVAGADSDLLKYNQMIEGTTSAFAATLSNRPDWLEEILAAGGDPHAKRTRDGAFPLHVAATRGFTDCARLLLDAGARPERAPGLTFGPSSALEAAAEYGNVATVEVLAARTGSLSQRERERLLGNSIILAAKGGDGYEASIKEFHDNVDLDWANVDQIIYATPQDEAAYAATLEVLVRAGASPNYRHARGQANPSTSFHTGPPLFEAAKASRVRLVPRLSQKSNYFRVDAAVATWRDTLKSPHVRPRRSVS